MGVKDYKISEHFNPNNPEIPSTYGCGYSEFETLRKLMTYVNSLYNAYLELNLSYSTMSETKEDSISITNNRKLSPDGNFTGTWEGFRPSQVDVAITGAIDANTTELINVNLQLAKKAQLHISETLPDTRENNTLYLKITDTINTDTINNLKVSPLMGLKIIE